MNKQTNTFPLEEVVAHVAHSLAWLFGNLLADVETLPSLHLMLPQLRSALLFAARAPHLAGISFLVQSEMAMFAPIPCNVWAALPYGSRTPTLRVEVPPGLDVMATPGALLIVLHQLLLNSLSYAPVGVPITLTCRYADAEAAPWPRRAQVNLAGPVVLLTLADQGYGVPKDFLPRLFTPRVSLYSSKPAIGLVLARALVRMQGGDLWRDDTPIGASFTSVWPASPIRWPCEPRDFGAQVRSIRTKAGLTAEELGRWARLSEATVIRIERGQRPLRLNSRLRITSALFRHPCTSPKRPRG